MAAATIASRDAFVALLRSRLGADIGQYLKRDKKGNEIPALSKRDPQLQLALKDERIADLVRHRQTIKSAPLGIRRIESMFATVLPDGTIPLPTSYGGSGTGRWSGGGDNSFNPLNLQPEQKGLLVPPPGMMMVLADYSQIEVRVLAWLTGDANLLAACTSSDIYCVAGSAMFGRPVVKGSNDRRIAKNAVLGLGYGMGAHRFRDYCFEGGTTIDSDMAQRTVDQYRALYTQVVSGWYQLNRAFRSALSSLKKMPLTACKCRARHYGEGIVVTLPTGRDLVYPRMTIEMDGQLEIVDYGKRVNAHPGFLMENIVQAVSRDILAEAILKIEAAGYPVGLHVYDSIVGIVPIRGSLFALRQIERIMIETPAWGAGLPLAVEAGLAKRYE